jgi:hypothetical protein
VRSVLGCLATSCIVLAVPGAIITRIFDSGPLFYVGSALLGTACAGFLVFTVGYWLAALFMGGTTTDRAHDENEVRP